MALIGRLWIGGEAPLPTAIAQQFGDGARAGIAFKDVTQEAGVSFVHDNAASPSKFLIETMGGGAAWIDYDGDGRLDLYLTNSAATEVFEPEDALGGALYRNLGGGRFTDVTEQAGVAAQGLFAMGVAVGDYDNDGDPDFVLTGYGRSVLFRNESDGTFDDVTREAGVANVGKWGTSAAWFDADRDGLLDLVVANYLDWSPQNNLYCGEPRPGYRSYCHPNKYGGQTPTFYRNLGSGQFEDLSEPSGLGVMEGNGLGVVCSDFDMDGWTDVFIANDSMENFLFRNLGDGTFEEVAFLAGVALGENGQAEAGMGVGAGDYDNDGLPDLYVTHLDFEFDRLYRNEGRGDFSDATFQGGIGYKTFDLSGFGTGFVDFDNDGWLDLFVANGHVLDNIALFHKGTLYAERKLLFRNTSGKFEEVGSSSGAVMAELRVSRAAAFADYDNDGDVDILVANNGQPPQLMRNEHGNAKNWLQVELVGDASNRDGIGATVTVKDAGLTRVMQKVGGGSYQAAHDPRLHFGLGSAPVVERVEVRWPSGAVDRLFAVPANTVLKVVEGAFGQTLESPTQEH